MSAPFHCVVTDTANSVVYALSSFAFSNDKLDRIVVLRSNPNPKSVDAITWTVVSSIDAKAFYDLERYTPTCVVSDSGILTALSSGFSNSNYEKVSRGFQYDPEGKSAAGFQQTGSGGWSNITFNGFVWPGDLLYRGSLFTYLSSGEKTTGSSTLALLTYNQSMIKFGTLDSATKTVIPASAWNLEPALASFATPIKEVAYDKGNLYVYVYNAEKVLMFPLTSLPAVLPSNPTSFDASSVKSVGANIFSGYKTFSGVFENQFYMLYALSSYKNTFLTTDSQGRSPLNNGTLIHGNILPSPFFVPIKDEKSDSPLFGIYGAQYTPSTLYGVSLSGSNIGDASPGFSYNISALSPSGGSNVPGSGANLANPPIVMMAGLAFLCILFSRLF